MCRVVAEAVGKVKVAIPLDWYENHLVLEDQKESEDEFLVDALYHTKANTLACRFGGTSCFETTKLEEMRSHRKSLHPHLDRRFDFSVWSTLVPEEFFKEREGEEPDQAETVENNESLVIQTSPQASASSQATDGRKIHSSQVAETLGTQLETGHGVQEQEAGRNSRRRKRGQTDHHQGEEDRRDSRRRQSCHLMTLRGVAPTMDIFTKAAPIKSKARRKSLPAMTASLRVQEEFIQKRHKKKVLKKMTCSDLMRRKGRHFGKGTNLNNMKIGALQMYCKKKLQNTELINDIVDGEILHPFNGRSECYFTLSSGAGSTMDVSQETRSFGKTANLKK